MSEHTTPHAAPSLADRPQEVRVSSGPGTATVSIAGADVTSLIQGYSIEHRIHQPPLLVLYASPRDGAVFEGLAHVMVGEESDPGPLIAAFLANVDAQALEEAALNREDLGDGRYALARAMLSQLADWAQGKR
ncbi:hypothetical protein ACIPW9_36130 [Streptomyces sp. NPDC090052]|uniref:hypothetical protein n=1 Tax=Streptomyces sp. NPDC090052 TaxID=3365931 RepID=UPI00380997AB